MGKQSRIQETGARKHTEISFMDMWKYFDIMHREHILRNPMSLEKQERVIALLHLKPGAQVLDIAVGKGEFFIGFMAGIGGRWGR